MSASIVSLNVGQPSTIPFRNGTVPSAFGKHPVGARLPVTPSGIAGDRQADLRLHSGPDKVACVYPSEHYAHWETLLGRRLPYPSFGENFTTTGLLEDSVCLGDVYQVGTAKLEVSQPRQPCYKIAAYHRVPKLTLWVQEAGKTGFYFRCLDSGEVSAGDELVLQDRPYPEATIAELNRLMHRDRLDRAALERILAVPALGAFWRRTFENRLRGIIENTDERLNG